MSLKKKKEKICAYKYIKIYIYNIIYTIMGILIFNVSKRKKRKCYYLIVVVVENRGKRV